MQEVIGNHPDYRRLEDLVQLVKVENYHQQTLFILKQTDKILDEKQDYLQVFFDTVNLIDIISIYYRQVQELKTAVLLELKISSELVNWAVKYFAEEIQELSRMAPLDNTQDYILALAIKACANTGDGKLASYFFVDRFKFNEKEIKKLQQENAALKKVEVLNAEKKRKRSHDEEAAIEAKNSQLPEAKRQKQDASLP